MITRYEYQSNQLHLIKQYHAEQQNLGVTLRFDNQGNVSFMQRQLENAREQLSTDDIERYKYEAENVLNLSKTLRAGSIRLVQGRWLQGNITACNGEPLTLNLSVRAQVWLAKRATKANDRLGLAWLAGPEGDQLLLAANEDFCKWEPKESDL